MGAPEMAPKPPNAHGAAAKPWRRSIPPRRCSAPGELRLPLLHERADALARVVGVSADVLRERLELQRRPKILLQIPVERATRETDRDRRTLRDLRRQLVRRG